MSRTLPHERPGASPRCRQIIEIVDAELKPDEDTIYVVMECGEIDLAHLLQKQRVGVNESFVCMCARLQPIPTQSVHGVPPQASPSSSEAVMMVPMTIPSSSGGMLD